MVLWGGHYECIHCPADKAPSDQQCREFQEKGWCPAVEGARQRYWEDRGIIAERQKLKAKRKKE